MVERVWVGSGWAQMGPDGPTAGSDGPKLARMSPRLGNGPKAHFWGCQKLDIHWTCVWYLSKIHPSKEYCDTHTLWMENGSWTKGGQTLDFLESRVCPSFVHMQGDQMAKIQIVMSRV